MVQKNVSLYITNIFFSAILSFSLIYALVSSLGLEFNALTVSVISLCLIVIFSLVFINKLSLIISAAVLAVSTVFILIFLAVKFTLSNILSHLLSLFYWINYFIETQNHYNREYGFILLMAMSVSIALFIYIFTIKRFNFYVLLISGVILFTIQWCYGIFVSHASFYTFLFIILIYYLKYIYVGSITKNSNEFESPAAFSIWTVPICGLIIIIAFLMPAASTPLQWSWLDNKVYQISRYFDDAVNSSKTFDYFSIANTGFGDKSNKLGGRVQLDKTVVMEVTSPRQVYLKGIVKDYYTGFEWINTSVKKSLVVNPENMFKSDYNTLNSRVTKYVSEQSTISEPFLLNDNVKISFKNNKTKSLFLPVLTKDISLPNKNFGVFVDSNGSLFSGHALKKDFNYSMNIISINLDSDNLKKYLRKRKKGLLFDESIAKRNLLNYTYQDTVITKSNDSIHYTFNTKNKEIDYVNNTSLIQLKALFENLNDIYSKYLQLPDNLPRRVTDLSLSITSSAKTDYDKAKAIEEYLSKEYPYTLNPGSTPKNRDFVDYFLFEGKQGYCTYYASAMTVMLRSVGIPARYVEGYVMPSKPKTGTTYSVTNEQAHAWVEVYFEGFGWVPFEPTSPFVANFYDNREVTANSGSLNGNTDYEEYIRRMQGNRNNNLDLSLLDEEKNRAQRVNLIIEWSVISLILFLVLLFLGVLLFNMLNRKITVKSLIKMNSSESILGFYKIFTNILALHGLKISSGETPLQFAERVDKFLELPKNSFQAVSSAFVVARYSLNEISEKEKNSVYKFYDNIIVITKVKLGKYKYFFYVYLLGRIMK